MSKSGRRGKPGISKATGYKAEIFNIVYDMRGGLEAYGQEFMIWLIYQLGNGMEVSTVADVMDLWYEYELEQDGEDSNTKAA